MDWDRISSSDLCSMCHNVLVRPPGLIRSLPDMNSKSQQHNCLVATKSADFEQQAFIHLSNFSANAY